MKHASCLCLTRTELMQACLHQCTQRNRNIVASDTSTLAARYYWEAFYRELKTPYGRFLFCGEKFRGALDSATRFEGGSLAILIESLFDATL